MEELIKKEINKIVQRYKNGESEKEIAKDYDGKPKQVIKILKMQGITIRKKIPRQKKEKAFRALKKSGIPDTRVDQFGHYINFYQYGLQTEHGWTITNNDIACHWRSVNYVQNK